MVLMIFLWALSPELSRHSFTRKYSCFTNVRKPGGVGSAPGSRLTGCGEGLLLAGLGHPVKVLLQHTDDKLSKEPPPLRLIESSAEIC